MTTELARGYRGDWGLDALLVALRRNACNDDAADEAEASEAEVIRRVLSALTPGDPQ